MAYSAEPDVHPSAAAEVLHWIVNNPPPMIGEYPLPDAAEAHVDLESGRSTGSLLLIP